MHLDVKNKINILLLLITIQSMPTIINAVSKKGLQPSLSQTDQFKSSAFWVSTSLGGGTGFDIDRDDEYSGKLFYFDMSAHIRYHFTVISSGLQGGPFNEVRDVMLYYLTFGKSFYQTMWREIIFSAGFSYNKLYWSDDMSDASGTDAIFIGIPLQFQYMFHLPVGIGLGISWDVNLNNRATTISFSIQAGFGIWML